VTDLSLRGCRAGRHIGSSALSGKAE
jgi:hypothetical protein